MWEAGSRLNTKEFWLHYFWALPDDGDNPMAKPITLGVSEEFSLQVDVDDFSYISLLLLEKGCAIEVAWDDEAQWQPFVLRLVELGPLVEAVCRRQLCAPWMVYLLLERFVGVDSLQEGVELRLQKRQMLMLSGLFGPQETEQLVALEQRPAFPQAGWVLHPSCGWVYEGEDAYSLRRSGNTAFPFAAWNRMLSELK